MHASSMPIPPPALASGGMVHFPAPITCVTALSRRTMYTMKFRPTHPTFVAGRPGGYATLLANKARATAAACVAFSALNLWFFWSNLPDLSAPAPAPYLPAAAFVAAIISAAVCRVYLSRARAAAVGARSERTVAKALLNLSPTALLHSVDLSAGGDADHLVLGPKLAVIETKTGSGPVRYEDGKLYVGNKALRGDPVAQSRRQALAAKQMFSSYCDAIVCVVDMKNDPFTVSSVTVCSVYDLASVLGRFQDRIQPAEARRRAEHLAPRCSTIHEKQHNGKNTAPAPTAPPAPIHPNRDKTLRTSAPRQAQPSTHPSSTQPPLRKLSPRRPPR